MRKMIILLSTLFIAASSQGALAQTLHYHTWVSVFGTDSSASCDVTTPCQTIANALGKTLAGGEITCLNTGPFVIGVTINKSITISCEFAPASNLANAIFTFPGFIITVASTDTVTLRGLDFDGANFPSDASTGLFNFTGAGTLRLERVKVSNIHGTSSGIYFAPTGAAKLHVVDSIIANNGSSGVAAGIYIKPGNFVTATIAIERSVVENNNYGILADGSAGGTTRGIVSDSFVSGNTNYGITAYTTGSVVALTVDNTKVTGNGSGLVVSGTNAFLTVGRSVITANGTGVSASGAGAIYSYGDNRVNGNSTTDGIFNAVIATK